MHPIGLSGSSLNWGHAWRDKTRLPCQFWCLYLESMMHEARLLCLGKKSCANLKYRELERLWWLTKHKLSEWRLATLDLLWLLRSSLHAQLLDSFSSSTLSSLSWWWGFLTRSRATSWAANHLKPGSPQSTEQIPFLCIVHKQYRRTSFSRTKLMKQCHCTRNNDKLCLCPI